MVDTPRRIAPKTPPVIRFEDVTYRIRFNPLVQNLKLQVEEGETLVLLGRSGSGKTTTLKLINQLLIPTLGKVFVFGNSTVNWNPIALRRKIGYVIQDVGLFPHFTVRRNISLIPTLEKWERDRIESKVQDVLELVGLDSTKFADRYPHQLSGGQRQRVGVARALAADPPLLLLDEPFGALDPLTRAEMHQEFLKIQKHIDKTMVFVTHDISEAFLFGTRIGLMKDGKLIALSSRDDFLESQDSEIRTFLEPFRNLVELFRRPSLKTI
jgi:osmoprotectant transport system ATP-binding protein